MVRRPLTLQARLMAAVIGFVSLILVIVAMITSATLGNTLQDQLERQLDATADQMSQRVQQYALQANLLGVPLTADYALGNLGPVRGGPDLFLAVEPAEGDPTGVIVTESGVAGLTSAQLFEALSGTDLDDAAQDGPDGGPGNRRDITIDIPDVGSYLVTADQLDDGTIVVTGLSRADIQGTMTQLFTVIALATLGGLMLLAATTALTISVSLRPLRVAAATATRVSSQPLDRGEVSITERVPDAEADPRTEIGRVGAALNTLLDHVDVSLSARQHNEERMRRFVADASHELRTPLASIRGYSELSLRALPADSAQAPDPATVEQTRTALDRIQAQSLRMTSLVEDLLLLARLDEGRELVHGTVDLTQLAVESLADARPTAPDHLWQVDVPGDAVVVLGDSGRLHQVVTNLLANARTHTPAGTTITLSVSASDTGAELRVHDNGPGVDPKVRDEMFARFARGDSSRARQTGGTGLGLAIVKAIVEGHGGSIRVESEPGATTFIVTLPLSPAA